MGLVSWEECDQLNLLNSTSVSVRGVTIHLPHDMIHIVILTSRYDTYRDTFNQTDRLTHTQPGHAISLFSC